MLQKIASMVKPIMRLRNWRVGVLAEFFPREANLLGLNENRGQRILLRLRYPGDETQFLPLENVVDTMLHELSHIVHGPHDQAFHALWDKLRDEHESLVRKGYTGEGFLGKGNRLGGNRVPVGEIKRQARAAAEKRREMARLAQGSGQKLGGQGILRGQNAREIIAAAAERRNRIERGCASATEKGRMIIQEEASKKDKVTTTKAEQQDENDAALMQAYIDMIQEEEAQLFGTGYVPPSQENPIGGYRSSNTPGNDTIPPVDTRLLREQQLQIERELDQSRSGSYSKPEPAPIAPSLPPRTTYDRPPPPPPARAQAPTPKLPEQEETWTCEICTLINPMQYLMCGACETERPAIYSTSSPESPRFPGATSASSSINQSARGRTQAPSTSSSSDHPNHHPAFAPRLKATDSLARFEAQSAAKAQAAPVGWQCGACGNFMESQWWTCNLCGRMKDSS